MNTESDISFVPNMDLTRFVRIIMPFCGTIAKHSTTNLTSLYVKLGRTVIRTSHSSTVVQANTLRNMLTAIAIYRRFYALNLPLHSIWQVNILVSGMVRMMKKRCMKMSLTELMEEIALISPQMSLNLSVLPVVLKIGSCQSVKDTAVYLILKEYEYMRLRMTMSKKA